MAAKFSKSKQSGVSLVEIMVSITIGLFILAGVIQLYATATQNSSMVRGSSQIQENARLLFSRIESDVSKAGYAGCLSFNEGVQRIENISTQTSTPTFNPTLLISGENNVAKNDKTFDQFIVNYAGIGSRVPVQQVSSDRFVVASNQSAQFEQGDLVVVGDCSSFGVFRVSNSPENTGVIRFETGTYNATSFQVKFSDQNDIVPAITYLYGDSGAFQYYVDTSSAGTQASSTCSTTNPQYCALYRKASFSANASELVDGVDEFEVEYGWRENSTGNLLFAHAGAVPSANWRDVDRIRVTATLGSINKVATNEGTDYVQRTYSRTFFLFNQTPGA